MSRPVAGGAAPHHRHGADHSEVKVQHGHAPSSSVEHMQLVVVLAHEPHMCVFAGSLARPAHAPELRAVRREDGEFMRHRVVERHHETTVGESLDVEGDRYHGFAVVAEHDIGDEPRSSTSCAEVLREAGGFLGTGGQGARPRARAGQGRPALSAMPTERSGEWRRASS